ncbi:MAG: TonB-dependent receptor [Tannerellaceae bacterium]|jgi:iron complex outermembrane receptor protein|nr:TonB-dependent receptor [Tannerellaceae bacterium]
MNFSAGISHGVFLFVALVSGSALSAQNTFRAAINDAATGEALIGAAAILKGTANGGTAGRNGIVTIERVSDGKQTFEFTYLGYESQQQTFVFPLLNDDTVQIRLTNATVEIGEIVVSSTRSARTIENIPTRMEFIGMEEIDESGNMNPGDIRMLLSESTGIQTQQTSPISANASIRIQGLDGRYTQILKDGFPLYSGAASGLGLLQTPPLDLKQVEIVKGATSTLYGGGAIAGLINLISKTPTDKRELKFQLNGTSAAGLDVIGFYAQRLGKTGLTLFASRNSSEPYDPAGLGLSAIPKVERYNLNPRFFVYFSKNTKADMGINAAFENRLGGDMLYLKGKSGNERVYFERNKTQRFSTQFALEHKFSGKSKLNIRNSFSYFKRKITLPDYVFDGVQNNTFSEINYSYSGENTEWVTGANLWTDNFEEKQANKHIKPRDYNQLTSGVFLQNLSKITDGISIESGLRGDYAMDYGFMLLPRLSALFKINRKWTSRMGGGLGYKTPAIFTEESERIQYQNVLPISDDINKPERSYGANADVNYRTTIARQIAFSINQLLFYTCLNNPLMLVSLSDGNNRFQNINGRIQTKGAETNIKIRYEDFNLYSGYTFTSASVNDNGIRYQNPLTPEHTLSIVGMYEAEDKWRIGIEAYYNSRQTLNDGATGQAYWVFGAMLERIWEHFSIYVNFENFTDTRQTRFGSLYAGTRTNPVFKDVYAPLDGFVINAGIKIKY